MTVRLNGSTSGYVELDAPAVAGNNTLVLPTGNGTNGQVLQTNGSGALSWITPGIVKAQTYYDAGSSTTSASYVNANGALFSYTPQRSSSTLILLFSFSAFHSLTSGVNNQSFHSIYEGSTQVGSGYTHQVASGSGGMQLRTMGFVQAFISNASTATRSFSLYHASLTTALISSTDIRATILEVAV